MVCYCKSLLAILVIVFAWIVNDFTQILLTIIGLVLLIMSIKPDVCCCCGKKPVKKAKKR